MAIANITSLGAADNGSSTTSTKSISAVNVAVGKTVFVLVTFGSNGGGATQSVIDSGGNIYTTMGANKSASPSYIRFQLFCCQAITTALSAGSITLNCASATGLTMAAFSADMPNGAALQSFTGAVSATSSNPSIASPVLYQADSLLIGVYCNQSGSGDTTTQTANGFAALANSGSAGNTAERWAYLLTNGLGTSSKTYAPSNSNTTRTYAAGLYEIAHAGGAGGTYRSARTLMGVGHR
jgi:hypothetical protein